MPSYEPRKSHARPQRTCIGFVEQLEEQRERKAARNRPHSWIARKLTIGIVVCLVGYTVYVYVARFCVPMIRKEANSMGGRPMGIAFLVVFSMLFLMFCWTYLKIVLTPPGFAKDHVAKTPPPVAQTQPPYHPGSWDSLESVAGAPYDHTATPSRSRSQPSIELPSHATSQVSPRHSPPNSRRNTQDTNLNMTQVRPSQRADGTETGTLDTPSPHGTANHKAGPRRPPIAHITQNGMGSGSGLPPPLYARRPPTHPALSPEYRYCGRDELIKPMRAHHCRACGTCVLKYDHHCPWIGQCVGAFNHKFFVNFLQWSTIFTIFTFATVTARNAQTVSSSFVTLDPQQIVIIALSGIFTLFTLALLLSHIHLILYNASTVEHLGMQRMRDRERSLLSQMSTFSCFSSSRHSPEAYGLPDNGGHSPFKYITLRRRILKQWDMEWGKITTEGNMWWLGSMRANWEATMGKGRLGWILPIGRSIGDGLTYPTNPRFDRDGRWRRRAEWPEGFR